MATMAIWLWLCGCPVPLAKMEEGHMALSGGTACGHPLAWTGTRIYNVLLTLHVYSVCVPTYSKRRTIIYQTSGKENNDERESVVVGAGKWIFLELRSTTEMIIVLGSWR